MYNYAKMMPKLKKRKIVYFLSVIKRLLKIFKDTAKRERPESGVEFLT